MLTLNIIRPATTYGQKSTDDVIVESKISTTKLDSLNLQLMVRDENAWTKEHEANVVTETNINREEIRMDQIPNQKRWAFIPLYKVSANGGMLYWQIGFDGIDHLEISHGYSDGIIRTDRKEVKLNSTGRPMGEQSLLQARQRYKLKYREGYQPAGANTPSMIKGMKGYEYKPNSIKCWPVYTQPKLNGIRMLCQDMCAGRMSMRSWLNNPYTHLTHLEEELRDFFEYLPRYATLDGELYNHEMDFTLLTSAVKTVKYIHPQLNKVQYWIFDIDYEDGIAPAPFEKRYELLVNAYRRYIQDKSDESASETSDPNDMTEVPRTFFIVPSQLARNQEEMVQQHDQHVATGYEGIMIKKISNGMISGSKQYGETLYKPGKGNHILKYKQFIDEEAIVVGVTEAEGTEKGAAILNVQDRRGNVFPIRMRGNFERRRLWFLNPQLVLGKEVTFRYQELSLYGVPRFPVGLAIRDYE